MAKHDERSVLAQLKLKWQAEIDYSNKVIRIPNTELSIHICGKIDFLKHYCGWRVINYKKSKSNVERD